MASSARRRRGPSLTMNARAPVSPADSAGKVALSRAKTQKWFDKKKAQLERGFTGIDEKATVESYLKFNPQDMTFRWQLRRLETR